MESNLFHLAARSLWEFLWSFCSVRVEPDGQWEMAEENENERDEKERKRVVIVWGLHSPCTFQAGADVGSTIAGWPGSWWGKKEAEWRCVCGKDLYANELYPGLTESLSLSLPVTHTLFFFSLLSLFPSCGQFGAEGLEDAVIQKSCLLKLCVPVTPSFVLLCDCQSACVCASECIQFSFSPVLSFCVCKSLSPDKFYSTFMYPNRHHFFQFTRFSSVFYEARLSKCYLK